MLLLFQKPRGAEEFTPADVPGLRVWLDASSLALSDGAAIATWVDGSGNGNDATQGTAGKRPTYVAATPSVRFDGSDDDLSLPDLSSLTEGEVFIVVKLDADPPAADSSSGLWYFGTVDTSHFPYPADGNVYDAFGTTARKTTVNPAPSLASWRVYNVTSRAGEWTSRLDGAELFTTATNTVTFPATPLLGRSQPFADVYLKGEVRAFLLYDRKLTADERAAVLAYLTP